MDEELKITFSAKVENGRSIITLPMERWEVVCADGIYILVERGNGPQQLQEQ